MIHRDNLIALINSRLEETAYFLVDVTVSTDNSVVVEIDSDTNVDIDFCAELNRFIESNFDREVEDYSLEVGSVGLTSPLKILRQYQKYIGKDVEVVLRSGLKHTGVLKHADEESLTVTESKMLRKEVDKRKKLYEEDVTFKYEEIKTTKYIINIK